jgi:hypothetical protein
MARTLSIHDAHHRLVAVDFPTVQATFSAIAARAAG